MSTSVSLPFTDIVASTTAVRASSYHPPFATGTDFPYNPVTTTALAHNPNPTTPAFTNDYLWIVSYLTIHKLSTASYRYSFLLWIVIVLFVLIFAILHWTGGRGGFIGAAWSKWAMRRRTWRKKHALQQLRKQGKKHQQPFALPSNAQLLSLLFLFVIPLILCVLGPDYIARGTKLWDLTHNLTRRDVEPRFQYEQFDLYRRAPIASTATTRNPEYTIQKAWWTAGGRTGTIAFALFPLVVLFSLKAPPFAILAIPFLIQVHFDKLARLHRWLGRLIWLITTAHVVTWGIQLYNDRRGSSGRQNSDKSAWYFVWLYPLFIEGVVAYVALTALVILSMDSFRTRYYEAFYILHVILVPITLVFSALHYPDIGWWCWAGLILWIGERLYRLTKSAYVNGLFGKWKVSSTVPTAHSSSGSLEKRGLPGSKPETWEMGVRYVPPNNNERDPTLPFHQHRPQDQSQFPQNWRDSWPSAVDAYPTNHGPAMSGGSTADLLYSPANAMTPTSSRPLQPHSNTTYPPSPTGRIAKVPPPGFAYATLMPGKVVRLRILTPRPIIWAPGQHVLLFIPHVSKWTTHPFTINGCFDGETETNEGRVVELIIRAKNGFTKDLWEAVCKLITSGPTNYPFASRSDPEGNLARQVNNGVLLRAYIDGPFGSAIRAHWGNHSTVMIITGGTGITFGASILEYLVLCLSGRDGQTLGGRPGGWGAQGFRTTRVRFVWLVREFAHIQWCATLIRRCIDMVPSSALQVDIFVSNVDPKRYSTVTEHSFMTHYDDNTLAPPAPGFMQRKRSGSTSSVDSVDDSGRDLVDMSYLPAAGNGDVYHSVILGHDEHVLDYTNFDGEDDTQAPGEANLNKRVQKEGRMRRAKSRRAANVVAAKEELKQRAEERARIPPPLDTGYSRPHSPPSKSLTPSPRPTSPRPTSPSRSPNFPVYPTLSTTSGGDEPHAAADAYRAGQTSNDHLPGNDKRNRWSVLSGDAQSGAGPPNHSPPRNGPSPFGSNVFASGAADSVRNLVAETGIPLLDIDADELEDMHVISEMARPGKPRVDRILADEVERSRGAIAVACCGPTSLNAVVRKVVAAQISPRRVLKGDMRGVISLVTEDFEW